MSEESRRPKFTIGTLFNSNVIKRTILGSIMLSGFIHLFRKSQSYVVLFTIALTLGIVYELISIVRTDNKPFSLNILLVFLLSLTIYSTQIVPALVDYYPFLTSYNLICEFGIIRFCSYALCLMFTIFSLKKHKLASQMLLFAVIHLSSYCVGMAGAFAIRNLQTGSFYYFFPAVLVISNDIWAYAIGKICGRTRLYELSPKKTLEGFVGAAFFTLLTSIALMYFKLNYGFLPDSMDKDISLMANSNVWFLKFPVAYLHSFAFAFFASFVAPFVGFLASAIKRTFKKKDFGVVIPGHGGLTDRMDCQVLMVFFTYYYLAKFFETRDETLDNLARYISDNYSIKEVRMLVYRLSQRII